MAFSTRSMVFKLHLYASLAVSLYVSALGLTGAIIAFQDEIVRLTHPSLYYVKPAPPRLSVADLSEAVLKVYPGQKITSYYVIGDAPDLAMGISVGPGSDDGSSTGLFVNPYTGQVLGTAIGNKADVVRDALSTIHDIHVWLALPRRDMWRTHAQSFVAWITVIALFLTVTGIWVWFPRMRFAIGKHDGRPFWYDVHATLGMVAAVFLILLTLTGIVLDFDQTMMPWIATLTSMKYPQPPKAPPPAEGAQPISIERALAIAGDALPGATPVQIWEHQVARHPTDYVVLARAPGDYSPRGRSHAIIDQSTGAVLSAEVSNTASATDLIDEIHTGTIYGTPTKVIMSLASLIIVLEVVSGLVMWIKRMSFREMVPGLAAAAAGLGIWVYAVFVPA